MLYLGLYSRERNATKDIIEPTDKTEITDDRLNY